MKLNAQDREIAVRESLNGPIIEIEQTDFPPGLDRHACRIDLEPVILRCDRHAPGSHITHRVVSPSMSELQFSCLGADRPCQELVSQTNAEVGDLPLQDTGNHLETCIKVCGIARTRRYNNAIRL